MARAITLLIVGVLGAGAVAWFVTRDGTTRGNPRSVHLSEVEADNAAAAAPERDRPDRTLKPRKKSLQAAPSYVESAVASATTTASAVSAPAVPAEHSEHEVTEEERRVYAASVFDSEAVDPAWSRSTEQELAVGLETLPREGVALGSVDCRSSLCRFEVREEQPGTADRYLRQLIRSSVWRGQGMAVREYDDLTATARVEVYLARPGAGLPEAPGNDPVPN